MIEAVPIGILADKLTFPAPLDGPLIIAPFCAVAAHVTAFIPAGRLSVMLTLLAVEGPEFVTVRI
ncbi:hypothetical protein D3C71_1335330 [compost metagenome]